MGWLSNYRWIKSLDQQMLPPKNGGKEAATKAELRVVDALNKLPTVRGVHHGIRLNTITEHAGTREIDIVAVTEDRVVLIEVKNFAGQITMNEDGVLHQNGNTRHWTFDRLDEVKKRLIDMMRQTGIPFDDVEFHTMLFFAGSGEVDESVTPGPRLTKSHVAHRMDHLRTVFGIEIEGEGFPKGAVAAINTMMDMCGTWDGITYRNGVHQEGDLLVGKAVDGWRERFEVVSFHNLRGPWATFFRGPQFQARGVGWDGVVTSQPVVPQDELVFKEPGQNPRQHWRLDHLDEIKFGYKQRPDWEKTVLMKPHDAKKNPTKKPSKKNPSKAKPSREHPPFKIGQRIKGATVSHVHDKLGVFFRLDSRNSGLYRKEKMEMMEWSLRENIFKRGDKHELAITKQRWAEKKSSWEIEVTTVD